MATLMDQRQNDQSVLAKRENSPSDQPRVVPTWELFRGKREVWIEHDGVRYRLRITRRNKLILQK